MKTCGYKSSTANGNLKQCTYTQKTDAYQANQSVVKTKLLEAIP